MAIRRKCRGECGNGRRCLEHLPPDPGPPRAGRRAGSHTTPERTGGHANLASRVRRPGLNRSGRPDIDNTRGAVLPRRKHGHRHLESSDGCTSACGSYLTTGGTDLYSRSRAMRSSHLPVGA